MNPSTGHLVKSLCFAPEGLKTDYEPVPPELERAAQKKLAGKEETTVSLASGGKLSRWAAKKRKEKMAKESKRKNRGR